MEDALLYSCIVSNLLDSTGKGKGSNSRKRKGGAPKGTAGGKKRKTAETKISKAKPRKAIGKKDKGKNAAKVEKPNNKATDRTTVSKKGNSQATMSKQKNGAVSKKVTGKNQAKVGKQKKATDRTTVSKKGNSQATMSKQKNGGTKKIRAKAAKPAKKRVEWVLKEGVAKDELLEALANDISDKWTNLGRRLNIEQSKLQAISKDFDSVHERAFQMLKHWKQKQGSGASYKSLSTALKHKLVERKDLAEKYCFKRQ